MKLWLLELKKYDYDQYDAFVISAENEKEAINLILEDGSGTNQKENNIKEVKCIGSSNVPKGIVLGSFNAG